MDKITKIINSIKQASTPKSTQYKNLQGAYKEFLKRMKTSDFSNAIPRYQIELSLLEDLLELAQKKGTKADVEKYSSLIQSTKEKLKGFGVEITKQVLYKAK